MTTRQCPECECPLKGIRIIDKAYRPMHASLEYAAGDAERGVWMGRFPIEGEIEGYLCDKCGRVLLYACPKKE